MNPRQVAGAETTAVTYARCLVPWFRARLSVGISARAASARAAGYPARLVNRDDQPDGDLGELISAQTYLDQAHIREFPDARAAALGT